MDNLDEEFVGAWAGPLFLIHLPSAIAFAADVTAILAPGIQQWVPVRGLAIDDYLSFEALQVNSMSSSWQADQPPPRCWQSIS